MKDSKNHLTLYWVCQGCGWLSFYIIYSSIAIFFTKFSWAILIGYFNTIVIGFLLTHQYRNIIKKKHWTNLGIKAITFRILFSSLAIGVLWAAIVLPLNEYIYSFFPPEQLPRPHRKLSIGIAFFMAFNLGITILIWSLIYFTYKYFTNFKETEIDKWRLEAAVKDAQLLALKAQINPHFMFNCLNNIRSLVIENPEKARDMILHLSELLRSSLQYSNKEKINLEDELDIVKNYLVLESIQYESRLKYSFDIQPETFEMKIPPMTIQLLVENAIKHGISLLPMGGEIKVCSKVKSNNLIVEILNTGKLRGTENDKAGIGLKNAEERLTLLFGENAQLTLKVKDEHTVAAKFKVPVTY